MNIKKLFEHFSISQKSKTIVRKNYCKKDYFRPYTNPEHKVTSMKHSHKPNWTSVVATCISFIMLVTMIWGFLVFNSNTRKLEELKLFEGLQNHFDSLLLYHQIAEYHLRYYEKFDTYAEAYKAYTRNVGFNIHSCDDIQLERYIDELVSEEFSSFIKYTFDILHNIKLLYTYMVEMELLSEKYVLIFAPTLTLFEVDIASFIDNIEYNLNSDFGWYSFEYYNFSGLLDSYTSILELIHAYQY